MKKLFALLLLAGFTFTVACEHHAYHERDHHDRDRHEDRDRN